MKGHVELTVWCGDCMDEGRDRPGMLGQVQRVRPYGALIWGVWSHRGTKMPDGTRNKLLAMQVLSHPRHPGWAVPDELVAHCARHGMGSVSAHSIVGKFGNLSCRMSTPRR